MISIGFGLISAGALSWAGFASFLLALGFWLSSARLLGGFRFDFGLDVGWISDRFRLASASFLLIWVDLASGFHLLGFGSDLI